jgi:adenylate cyclase
MGEQNDRRLPYMTAPSAQRPRRLAAIFAADVAGYSRLMGADEVGTLASLKSHRGELIDPKIRQHRGRLVKTAGDGLLAEFASIVDAVQCAVEIQRGMATRNAATPPEKRIAFRIGINLGDIIADEDDIYGDGVNVAARLEAAAEPGGLCLSGAAHEHVAGKLPFEFADFGAQPMKNIARPVHVYGLSADSVGALPPIEALATARPDAERPSPTPPDRPSIAVLPFVNFSGDPEQTYFSDGVTEDIITELSRFRSLLVIARNSSFAFREQPIDITEIARRLGVQYVLEGSVRRVGSRVRVTAQLIDAARGTHVWAERYDRDLADIFEVQDEVVRTVVATVAGRLEAAGAELARRKPAESLAAYDYVLRGLEQLNQAGDRHNMEARRLFEKALELDPGYPAAHTYLALAIYVQWTNTRVPGELEEALEVGRRALALDDNDSRIHRVLSVVYAHLREHDRAEFHGARSVALNPNDTHAALTHASRLRDVGRAEEAVGWVQKAMQINPCHPNWYWNTAARILHDAGRYQEAVDAYARIEDRPSFYHAYVAACLAELGRMEEARDHAGRALAARPDFSIAAWGKRLTYRREGDRQRFLDSLRKAGLPE